jgi:hypothetical protein
MMVILLNMKVLLKPEDKIKYQVYKSEKYARERGKLPEGINGGIRNNKWQIKLSSLMLTVY